MRTITRAEDMLRTSMAKAMFSGSLASTPAATSAVATPAASSARGLVASPHTVTTPTARALDVHLIVPAQVLIGPPGHQPLRVQHLQLEVRRPAGDEPGLLLRHIERHRILLDEPHAPQRPAEQQPLAHQREEGDTE